MTIKDIPDGWRVVEEGPALGGDKYWNITEKKWYPVTVNSFKDAQAYAVVIRKHGG